MINFNSVIFTWVLGGSKAWARGNEKQHRAGRKEAAAPEAQAELSTFASSSRRTNIHISLCAQASEKFNIFPLTWFPALGTLGRYRRSLIRAQFSAASASLAELGALIELIAKERSVPSICTLPIYLSEAY
jgi:hypothetical protein